MADHNNKAEPTLHGNRAKIDPSRETAFFAIDMNKKPNPRSLVLNLFREAKPISKKPGMNIKAKNE